MNVVYLEIDDATNADPAAGVAAFTGMASANPDLKAIIIDHGNLTSTIPTYMKAANLAPGSLYAAGFDLPRPRPCRASRTATSTWSSTSSSTCRASWPSQQLCLAHQYGFSGLFVNTGGGFVDKSNIDVIAPLVEQQIR